MRYQMIFSFPLILVCTARRCVEGAAGAGAGDLWLWTMCCCGKGSFEPQGMSPISALQTDH